VDNKFIIELIWWDTVEHFVFCSLETLEENERKLVDILSRKQNNRPDHIDFGSFPNGTSQILKIDSRFNVSTVRLVSLEQWVSSKHI